MEEKQQHTIRVLQRLVETCRDSQTGYREAAEKVSNQEVRAFFADQSLERGQFAGELEGEIERLGKPDPDRKGSARRSLRRAWMDLKAELGGDREILSSVVAGEEAARRDYERVLQQHLPQHLERLVQRQGESVFAAHDHVRLLLERKAA